MQVEVRRDVAAPASRVWEVLTDLRNAPEHIGGIVAVEVLDGDDGFAPGTRWRETRRMFGREAVEEMTVTAVDPGRSYTVEATSHGAHYTTVMAVEPTADLSSRVTMTFGATTDGLVARVLSNTVGRLAARATRRMCEEDLADIARAAEAG